MLKILDVTWIREIWRSRKVLRTILSLRNIDDTRRIGIGKNNNFVMQNPQFIAELTSVSQKIGKII